MNKDYGKQQVSSVPKPIVHSIKEAVESGDAQVAADFIRQKLATLYFAVEDEATLDAVKRFEKALGLSEIPLLKKE